MANTKIKSAEFKKGLKGDDSILHNGKPQIAFIGRSNVGKSSLINSLTGVNGLARTSNTPGRTQEFNVFEINQTHYFVDLPGYGFARLKLEQIQELGELINWYLFESPHSPKIVVIIDAEIGPTNDDLDIIDLLAEHGKDFIVVANKIDKIKKSHYLTQMKKISEAIGPHTIVPYSSKERKGMNELLQILL